MKKIILATFLAISVLSMTTSCNSDVEPVKWTPQSIFAMDISSLMRNGLFGVFAYEEFISAKIAKGEDLPPAITVLEDETTGDITGWQSDFTNEPSYLTGKIIVTFNGSPLDNDVTKTIDCSQIKLSDESGNIITLFGTIEVINNSTTDTETSRTVNTNQFGWGRENNDLSLIGYYSFNSKYSNKTMTECRISGNGIYGNHREHGAFTQDIVEELVVGQYSFFTGGS
ncbi:MAG: hypothetical protein LBH30_00250, partial [Prevotellaceae bacterium]|nr:hypothetical protein [Prevotellaceae bacterium]